MELKLKKVYLLSLGCPKNLVDSEIVAAMLAKDGYMFTVFPEEADIIIVNTCCFIKEATEESVEKISQMAYLKKNGSCKKLIVMGCLPQRYKERVFELVSNVDLFLGTGDFIYISRYIKNGLKDTNPSLYVEKPTFLLSDKTPRILSLSHTAYVKIAEGCSHRCSFCIIPYIKGPYQSRSMISIKREVESLVDKAVKEIILIAQDTTFYGYDLYKKRKLVSLLKKLVKIKHIKWIRLLYCHPRYIDSSLLKLISQESAICKYLDIPLQHVSDKILKRMGRGGDPYKMRKLIEKIRKIIPNISIRTTFIVGFPGETKKDFSLLKEFVKDVEFEHVGVLSIEERREQRHTTILIKFQKMLKSKDIESLWRYSNRYPTN